MSLYRSKANPNIVMGDHHELIAFAEKHRSHVMLSANEAAVSDEVPLVAPSSSPIQDKAESKKTEQAKVVKNIQTNRGVLLPAPGTYSGGEQDSVDKLNSSLRFGGIFHAPDDEPSDDETRNPGPPLLARKVISKEI